MPKDPVMLLSYVNTQLRDYYSSLDEMCHCLGVDADEIKEKLATISYKYDSQLNKFV